MKSMWDCPRCDYYAKKKKGKEMRLQAEVDLNPVGLQTAGF